MTRHIKTPKQIICRLPKEIKRNQFFLSKKTWEKLKMSNDELMCLVIGHQWVHLASSYPKVYAFYNPCTWIIENQNERTEVISIHSDTNINLENNHKYMHTPHKNIEAYIHKHE